MGVERSKNVLGFLSQNIAPRQLKSLGTDAFIASGSFLNRMHCDKGVRSRQKEISCMILSLFRIRVSRLYFDIWCYRVRATTDLRSGKVTKIKLSALLRTLIKNKVATITLQYASAVNCGRSKSD